MGNRTLARYSSALAGLLGVLAASLASGADEQLPPRSEWRATASSTLHRGMTPAMAIDGDPSTKWDGNFAPGNWLQVDMDGEALIGSRSGNIVCATRPTMMETFAAFANATNPRSPTSLRGAMPVARCFRLRYSQTALCATRPSRRSMS